MSSWQRGLLKGAAVAAAVAKPAAAVVNCCPGKLAQALDWNKGGTVLTMSLRSDGSNRTSTLDLAIASHPRATPAVPLRALPSVPLRYTIPSSRTEHRHRRRLCDSVAAQMASIVSDYAVCGLLVAWPVQRDSGRCGAACGRVLHALEELAAAAAAAVPPPNVTTAVTTTKPVCLYDAHYTVPDEDEWGRSAAHGMPSAKERHVASHEQYYASHPHANVVDCAALWTEFSQRHWPEECGGVVARAQPQTATADAGSPAGAPPHGDVAPAAPTPTILTPPPPRRTTTTPLGRKKAVDLFAWINNARARHSPAALL